MDRASDKRANL